MEEINEKELYLVFVKKVGEDASGFDIHQFLFSDTLEDIDEGETCDDWGVLPACNGEINPPMNEKISVIATLKTFYIKFNLIQNSNSHSMWDCIDGIIPLMYEDVMNNCETFPDKRLFVRFGETLHDINEKFAIWSNTKKRGDSERNEQVLQLKY
jgi:hypothetical protein